MALTAVFLIGCGGGGGSTEASPAVESGQSSAPDGALSIVAESGDANVFNVDSLEVAAGQPFSLELKNPDVEPHNVSVFTAQGGENLFRGDFADPGEDITYDVPALPAGDLYFQCDIHPEMSGTFKVSA
ncbi:MAG: cupredoxin domain-containing protein [Actinomycetota bacterium]